MNIFGLPEARYYCGSFAASTVLVSIIDLIDQIPRNIKILREGTTEFGNFRDCSLRGVDRDIFLAASNFRRSLDLMMPASASWAHVTLYYSSFYAARALMGLFGLTVTRDAVVEVSKNQPGNQELSIDRKPQSTFVGPHRRFWDFFYASVPPLRPLIRQELRYAIYPVQGSITWLIDTRNAANYDSDAAYEQLVEFQTNFSYGRFPSSLTGPINTQYAVAEALLLIVSGFVRQCGLTTDALNSLQPSGPRRVKVERLVSRARPAKLASKTKWRAGML